MHREALEEGQKDIIEQCFDSYAYKIDELEEKDLRALRQRKYKLAEMKRNILKDLEDAQADREESMRERERIHTDNSSFLERRQFSTMRMRAEEYRREIEGLRDCLKIQMDQAK